MKKIFFSAILFASSLHYLFAQRLTHGPIIGAVTDHSARVYVRTSSEAKVVITASFPDGRKFTFGGKTDPALDTSIILDIVGLPPFTDIALTISVNGVLQPKEASFKTFPTPDSKAPMVFTFGSCIEQLRGDSIFIAMAKQKPAFFLHLGDWTYPDHSLYPYDSVGSENYFYSADYNKVKEVYRVRYSMPNMNKFLEHTPVDFIHDDDDFVFDENSRYSQMMFWLEGNKTVLKERPFPPGARENVIKGYLQFFPHYPILHDSLEGLYHSFRYGNIEIFFLDSRAERSAESEAFKTTRKGNIVYCPDSTHTILGKEQMAWLLKGLQNSTADWKFIISGVNFNMSYHRVINLALTFQRKMLEKPDITGGMIASMLAATWAGYPADQAKLINYCADNKIKNVIVLSGDSHSSSLDDGKNSGLPELCGSNMGVANSKIPSILYNKVGLDLWDKGGQGIHNNNYNYCFGKVEVFGPDSIKLNVVDVHGEIVTSCILKNGIVAKNVSLKDMNGHTARTRRQTRKDLFHLIGHVIKK